MKLVLSALIVMVLSALVIPVPVGAQSPVDVNRWRQRQQEIRDSYGRENREREYDRYDPRYDGRRYDRRYDSRRYGSGGAWDSWNRRPYRGDYLYEYPYQGQYQGSWGRIVRETGGDPYFDAVVIPCETVSKEKRWEKGVAKTALGAILGAIFGKYTDFGAGKGAMAGAGIGGAVALLNDSNLCSPPERVHLPVQPQLAVQPTTDQSGQGGQASTSTLTPSVPANVAGSGMPMSKEHGQAYRFGPHPLTNETKYLVDVFDGNKCDDRDKCKNFVGTMQSGESWDLDRPRSRYRGWAQIPNKDGSFDSDELDIRPNANGWTFVD